MIKLITIIAVVFVLATGTLLAGDAKAIYDKECTKCHGADGKGDTKMGKKFGAKDCSDAKVQAAVADPTAFKAIKEGLKDKAGKTLMNPTEGVSDADMKAVAAYMRTFQT